MLFGAAALDVSPIVKGHLLGSQPFFNWMDSDGFRQNRVHIVANLQNSVQYDTSKLKALLHLPMEDLQHESAVPSRERFERFLGAVDLMARGSEGNVLWHCRAGINRSAFALAAYLAIHKNIPIDEAIALIRANRDPGCLSNRVFLATLQKWYR